MAPSKKYTVFVSPDGRHEQVVGSKHREKQLRFEGWKPKQEPAPKTAPKTEPPKEPTK
ncbi:hypothetical protein [Streptomonospora wellingtoniae]|uniref:Uncharacterized protein n=1 Tax=Streptomonospora wellingtoniae TaxID=3075544 RepID=A0ABU2KUD0_9ACTN|nr:hypothetical protein [Streptomonospora sp. DSM 45055]MDT0302899.1 hypothetical protein [Streptomonospora sp. DSM 45055]